MSDNNRLQAFENLNETDSDINENILDLSIVIDGLFNLILKETNEGKEEKVIKQHVLNYIHTQSIPTGFFP